MTKQLVFIFGLFMVVSCTKPEATSFSLLPGLGEVPQGFPEVEEPEDNAFTSERWALGRKLFFDPILSSDESLSCASCHHPGLAFGDDQPTSSGVGDRPGTRNSPSLANVGYHPYYTREGGVPTLEMQILVPIQEHNEFDFNILLIADRMKEDPAYVDLAKKAYGREPDAFVITRAIACFERSLLSGNSAYDQYIRGISSSLSSAQVRGMELFFSPKANCSQCHSGFNFTNYAFENNGLYGKYQDNGRYRLTGLESDKGRFKVPSLRNIAVTGPYMHDGSVASLYDVMEHYESGGHPHPNKSEQVKPLDLSEQEINDIVQFLNALTDQEFLHNPLFN